MTEAGSLKHWLGHAASFVLNFAHGSLLVAGVMVLVAISYLYASQGSQGLDPRSWMAADATDAYAEVAEEQPAAAVPDSRLSAEYARLAQYIAKRYKVSSTALEELVRTAIREGREARVDPVLILAVTSVESRFNPMAESVFGAQGLMQIIPRFHQDKIDASRGATALLDPAENIRVGARILRDYLRINGDLGTALQQYGGVSDVADVTYPTKVMTELERFRQVMKYGSVREVAETTAPAVTIQTVSHEVVEQPVAGNPG